MKKTVAVELTMEQLSLLGMVMLTMSKGEAIPAAPPEEKVRRLAQEIAEAARLATVTSGESRSHVQAVIRGLTKKDSEA